MLFILGLNNSRWLQGVPTWDAFRGAGKDKPVQLEQVSTGGRGELPQMERDRLVAEWCRLVGEGK